MTRRASPAAVPLAVGLIVLGAMLITVRGSFGGGQDEEIVYVTAANLAAGQGLALGPRALAEIAERSAVWDDAVVPARDGRYYAVYGPLQALLAVPLLALGRAVAGDAPLTVERWVGAFNPLLTALTAAWLSLWLGQLGYGRRVAAAGGLGWALSGLAWPYAKTFLSEPLTGFCYLLCLWAAERGGGRSRAWAGLAGLAGAAAVLCRPHNLILLPVLLGPLLAGSRRGRRGRWAAAGGPIAVVCGWWLWFNQHRFGAPLDFGYQAGIQRDFALANLPVGVLGQLVSPGRGVLFYAPWVLLAIPGFAAVRRRHRPLAWTLVGAGALQLVFYALRSTWWGNWCWGPRYLVPVLPLVAMLAAPAVAERRWRRWGWGLAGLGTVAAWSGLVVYNGLYQDLVFRRADGLRELLWSPHWSPLIGHWRELNAGTFDLMVGRLLEAAPAVGLAGLVIRGLPACLGLWLVWRELHRDRA